MRVLIVEDDPMTSRSLEMSLRAEGMVVDATGLGEDGLEIGKLYEYDIILLDLVLPDMDGYEVLRRLRASRITTPVLILSGLSEAPGRTLRMSELAATANSSLSRLSHVVSRLEAKGWVRRESCPGDGRFINAVLTDEGWEKVKETAPGHVAAVRELLVDTLTEEEFAQFGAISAKVLAAQGIKVVVPK